jgi:hypothetical protein
MKKLLLLFLVFFLSASYAYAQQYEDVVYLKNGSVIHGTIVEQVPNVSVKVKTRDGNIFVYKIEEIEKMTKEVSENDGEGTDIADKNKTSGFFMRFDASVGFPTGELTKGWDVILGNNFHFGHIFSKNIIASGNLGWDMWMTSGTYSSAGNGYEIYWGGSFMAGSFKTPFVYFARVGGGGQVNFPPIGDAEVGGNLVFGAGFGFKPSKSKAFAIILEPSYHLTLNDKLPCSVRISIGFMKTL